jgi:hypothetical protein
MPINKFMSTGTTPSVILPRLSFDARSGILSKVNRVQIGETWTNQPQPLPFPIALQMDFANIEIVWQRLVGVVDIQAMKYRSLVDGSQQMIEQPSDDHKLGFRIQVYNSSLLGADIHEFGSTAMSVRNAVDAVHDAFEAATGPEYVDKAPIVTFTGTTPIVSPKGTAHAPVLAITGWESRSPFDNGAATSVAPGVTAPPAAVAVSAPPPPHNAPEFP